MNPPEATSRPRRRALRAAPALAAGLLALSALAGCDGPPQVTRVTDEPICPDFELGAARTKMRGGLRAPVLVEILEDPDDEKPLHRAIVYGRRSAGDDKGARILVPDSNDEFTVRFSQCENEWAPAPVDQVGGRKSDEPGRYECGAAKEYKRVPLKTQKGDPASRAIKFEPPPNPACWTTEVPAAPPAEPAGAEASGDAGAAPDAPDASAAPAAPDAGP